MHTSTIYTCSHKTGTNTTYPDTDNISHAGLLYSSLGSEGDTELAKERIEELLVMKNRMVLKWLENCQELGAPGF